MKCEVIAAIRGLQFSEEENDGQIEVLTPAQYYVQNGAHYLIYEEVDEESGAKTKNILKYREKSLEFTRKGMVNAHMVFEEQKKNVTSYGTPFGNILIGLDTSRVHMDKCDRKMNICAEYSMDINYEHFADCRIQVEICPREEGASLF